MISYESDNETQLAGDDLTSSSNYSGYKGYTK